MGAGIAYVTASAGMEVVLIDQDQRRRKGQGDLRQADFRQVLRAARNRR
jgi:3-hydroxyacyl-CoA dehydrogenase